MIARGAVADDGLWQYYAGDPRRAPALFLDRDGVLVEGVDYLHEPTKTFLFPGAGHVVASARTKGFHIVIVTNQSGIGRGYFEWADFIAVQNKIAGDLKQENPDAVIDAVLACPFSPEGEGPMVDPDHPGRKPNPGMLFAAASQLEIDLKKSWIIGDTANDIQAGRNAGIAGGVHVLSGHGHNQRKAALGLATSEFQVIANNTIADCIGDTPFSLNSGA